MLHTVPQPVAALADYHRINIGRDIPLVKVVSVRPEDHETVGHDILGGHPSHTYDMAIRTK